MQFSKYLRYLFCCLLVISTNSCRKETPVDSVPEQQDLTLKPPGDLQIISMTETEVVLSWTDNNSSETSFDVEQSTDSTYFSVVKSVSANVTTATIPGTYFTTNIYYFRVKAKSSTTTSGPSNVVQRILTLKPPGDLQIISMTETEVVLSWTDNNSSEQSYDVEQSTDSTYFSFVKSVSANVTTATIPGTYFTTNIYYFRVKAKSSIMTSGPSNVVQRTLFPAPTALQILSMTATSVALRWTDNSSTETGFDVEQSVDSSAYSVLSTVGANVTSTTINAVFDLNKTYSFRVCAKTALIKSAYSNALSRTLGSWVFVKGGSFQMGRISEFSDERPVHSVTLKNYYIGKYEVTVRQYREFATAKGRVFPPAPSWGWNDDDPMVDVSWNDARDYCIWISDTTGKTVRMPTEAEWEYAARGGKFSQGCSYSGSNTIDGVAWCFANSSGRTQPVGTKQPNELGIYDMSGNAWEWCADWYGSYSSQPQTNPIGPSNGTIKVFRGGSWFDYGLGTSDGRVEMRYNYTPGSKVYDGGFRVVQQL